MEQTNLNVIDQPDMAQTGFGPDMNRWLANMTDTINDNFNSLNNLLAVGQQDIGGGGVGPITVTVAGIRVGDSVNTRLVSTTNPGVKITDVTVGAGSFNVTFSADPGASAIIVYQGFAAFAQ